MDGNQKAMEEFDKRIGVYMEEVWGPEGSEHVAKTSIWELEEELGAGHFNFCKSSASKIGYRPLRRLNPKKEEEILRRVSS